MFSEEMICSLNDLELEVYKYVVRNADKVCYMRIREFADAAHVSTSTILRFCKKAGCDGYAEFKIRLRQHLEQAKQPPVKDDVSEVIDFLKKTCSAEFEQKLDMLTRVIFQARHIFFVGRGLSNIDMMPHGVHRMEVKLGGTPHPTLQAGEYYPSHTGVDFYHHYKEDIALMAELGLKVFRTSISWSRLYPHGDERTPNSEGVAFYRNVFQECRKYGIEPLVTLCHFDIPMGLVEQYGSWRSRKTLECFARYARKLFAEKQVQLHTEPGDDALLRENTVDFISFSYYASRCVAASLEGKAVNDGVELMGYIAWSGIDLVSASTGEMSKRYGFVYVDKQDDGTGTLARSKKDSFDWYQKVIRSNGADL